MNTSAHCLCSVDIRVVPRHISLFVVDTNRKPVRLEQVFFSAGRHNVGDMRIDSRQQTEEALPREDRKAAAQEVVRASSHDPLSRHVVEALGEYRWTEAEVLDSHDAACSPQGGSMKVRGGEYSQDGMEVVELRQVTWQALTHSPDVRSLDPEDNLESLDLVVEVVEDKIEVEEGMAIDGPCPGVVDDGLQNHCMARASGSTPGLGVAYLRLEEGSCTT